MYVFERYLDGVPGGGTGGRAWVGKLEQFLLILVDPLNDDTGSIVGGGVVDQKVPLVR
ncbi:hypothetical protein D3C73_1560390 [compost metagenome]